MHVHIHVHVHIQIHVIHVHVHTETIHIHSVPVHVIGQSRVENEGDEVVGVLDQERDEVPVFRRFVVENEIVHSCVYVADHCMCVCVCVCAEMRSLYSEVLLLRIKLSVYCFIAMQNIMCNAQKHFASIHTYIQDMCHAGQL